MSTIKPNSIIKIALAIILIAATAIMALTDTHAAAQPSDCDPAQMVDHAQFPSSNERYAATDFAIVDRAANRCAIITESMNPTFLGWTADGRYAVFNAEDGVGVVFDARNWARVPIDASAGAVIAFAPIMKRVLFADGSILYPSNAEQYALFTQDAQVIAAAFSPGEQFLAYVIHDPEGYALYASAGDGSDPRRFLALDVQDGDPIRIEWNQNGTPKFTLTVGDAHTEINVWTGEINP